MTEAAKWIFEQLQNYEMNIREFSQLTGISRKVLYDWRDRNKQPSLDSLERVARFFHIKIPESIAGKAVYASQRALKGWQWEYIPKKPRHLFCKIQNCEWRTPEGYCPGKGCLKYDKKRTLTTVLPE